jgi:hypothetical protein
VCRADNFTTFMYQLSGNWGASSSLNPQNLSRLLQGLSYPTLFKTTWFAWNRLFDVLNIVHRPMLQERKFATQVRDNCSIIIFVTMHLCV